MKRRTPATMVLAPLAVISSAAAIHAYATDSDAAPAAPPVRQVVLAPPATEVAPAPARHGRRAHRRPVARHATPTNATLAAVECREESFDDAAEFQLRFGHAASAIRRCTRVELAAARAECRADALEDPLEHRGEYGTARWR
jgi:hypothetical protein